MRVAMQSKDNRLGLDAAKGRGVPFGPCTPTSSAATPTSWWTGWPTTCATSARCPSRPRRARRRSAASSPPRRRTRPSRSSALFDDFRRVIVPGMTHWNHPGWFAYFPGNNSPPSILGEMLTAALGAQCMSWATSPAATELEQVVMDWLRQMLGLPAGFVGVIQDTASTATLVALLTRARAGDGRAAGEHGLAAGGPAHGLRVRRGALLGGQGGQARRLRSRSSPSYRDRRRVRAAARTRSTRLIAADRAPGLRAGVRGGLGRNDVVHGDRSRSADRRASADATASGSTWTPPTPARRRSCPSCGRRSTASEAADSFVFNPHKWMLTNFDCTAYFVRDPAALLRTFQATPEYLRTAHDRRRRQLSRLGHSARAAGSVRSSCGS